MPGGRVEVEVVPDLRDFPNKLGSGLKASTGLASTLGKGLGLAIAAGTAVAAVGLKQVIDLGIEYTGNLNELQAVTQATGIQMTQVGNLAKQLGADMSLPATSAADAAAAMKELAKGGLSVDEAMTAAKGTLQLAAAAQIDAARAAEIQSDALNQFGLAADQAGHVADVLANTANAASGEITDMANALKFVGPVARALNVDIDSTATAIGLLAVNGIRGEQAGTSLRGIIASLASPSKPAAEALKTLGIAAFDAGGKFIGLRALTEQLSTAKGRLSDAEFTTAAAIAFGNEGLTAATSLAASGATAFEDMAKSVTRSGGAAEVAAAKTQGLGGAWEGLKSQLETTGIEIFEAIDGPLEKLVRSAADRTADIGEGVVRGLETAIAAGEVYGPRLADAIRSRAGVVRAAAEEVLRPLASGGLLLANEAINTGIGLFGNFTDVLNDVVDGARPVAEGIRDIATSATDGDGAVSTLAAGVGLLGDGIATAAGVLVPAGQLLGAFLSAVSDLPGPLQAAVAGLIAYKLASSALSGSDVGGIRRFSDEMRVQTALAAANGVQLDRTQAALAAYQTTQIPAIAATRRFTDVMGDLRREAESAGRPIGVVSAAVGALAERSPAVAGMRQAYTSTFSAIAQGSERVALSAGIAAEAVTRLGTTAAVGMNRVALEVEGAGQRVGGFGAGLRSTFDSARDAVTSRSSAIVSAVQAIPTGVGVAAINVQDRVRGMVTSIGDAVSSLPGRIAVLPTAIGVGVIGTLDRVPGAVAGAVDALGRFGAVAGGVAAAGARGLLSAVTGPTGLISALGGPWGVAIAAAGVGLSLLAARQQDAAKAAQQHASYVDSLAAALHESNGAINENVRAATAKALQDTKVADTQQSVADATREAGVSLGDLTKAMLDGGGPLDVIRTKLKAVAEANKEMATTEGGGDTLQWTGSFNAKGEAANALLTQIDGLAAGFKEAQAKEAALAQAIKDGRASMLDASDTGRTLSSAMETLSSRTASADDKARALKTALDALAGGSISLEAAQFRVAEVTDRLGDIFAANGSEADKAAAKAKGFGDALLNADGSLSSATENGRNLRSALQDLTTASADAAQKTYDMAIAQGESVPAATAKAVSAVQASRDQFVGMAKDMGISAVQAEVLADRAGLIPTNVAIAISTPGDDKTRQELAIIKGLVDAVPPGKDIHMKTISADAEKKLEELGFKVTHMDDGTVTIQGNTQPAQNALDAFLRSPATKFVSVVYTGGEGLGIGSRAVNYHGNILAAQGFANGGMARPFKAGTAQMFPPRLLRITGDRMVDDEAYIPVNRSLRSQQLLQETASRMGYDLIRRFAIGGFASGQTATSAPAPAMPAFPTTLTLVDSEGAFLGRMRVVAEQAVAHVEREVYLRGGRR